MKRWMTALAALCSVSAMAQQQPWQKMQMPTASQVASAWKTPPSEYGPEPYYGFGGAMNETVIRRDLDTLQSLGYRAVTVQAGADMPYPYLSDGYFKLFRTFVEEAKKRNMRVWIVDDAGYPSGFAGGKFTELKPELRMQALVAAQKIQVVTGEPVKFTVGPETVAITAINSDDGSTIAIPFSENTI